MFNELAKTIFEGNKSRGFWEFWLGVQITGNERPMDGLIDPEAPPVEPPMVKVPFPDHYVQAVKIALIHSEASEMLEAIRSGSVSKLDNTTPEHHEELADIMIRCLDYAGAYNVDLDAIITAKLEANAKRGYRHGGKAF